MLRGLELSCEATFCLHFLLPLFSSPFFSTSVDNLHITFIFKCEFKFKFIFLPRATANCTTTTHTPMRIHGVIWFRNLNWFRSDRDYWQKKPPTPPKHSLIPFEQKKSQWMKKSFQYVKSDSKILLRKSTTGRERSGMQLECYQFNRAT